MWHLYSTILKKSDNIFGFGPNTPTPALIGGEIWHGGLFHAQLHSHQCNVSPLQGEKPKIAPQWFKYHCSCFVCLLEVNILWILWRCGVRVNCSFSSINQINNQATFQQLFNQTICFISLVSVNLLVHRRRMLQGFIRPLLLHKAAKKSLWITALVGQWQQETQHGQQC